MKTCAPILFLTGTLAVTACAGASRQTLRTGENLYLETNYAAAAVAFNQAAQTAAKEKLDPAVARYNEANALLQGGNPGAAISNYTEALRTSDLGLQNRTFYNRGNAFMALGFQQEQGQKLEEAGKSVDEALSMYENAMTLLPSDEAAKVNYELALKKKEELKQKQQAQQQQQKQDQKQDQKKDQQKQDQQQKEDQQKQDQQQQDQQKEQEQKDKQQQQEQQKQQQQNQDQQQQAQAHPEKSEEMTPEEAKMVLDSMKQDEQQNRDRLRMFLGQPVPVEKDW